MVTRVRKSMIEETKKLIAKDGRSMAQLAKDAEVSKEWLYKFIAGEIKDPGFTRIVELNTLLKRKRKRKAA